MSFELNPRDFGFIDTQARSTRKKKKSKKKGGRKKKSKSKKRAAPKRNGGGLSNFQNGVFSQFQVMPDLSFGGNGGQTIGGQPGAGSAGDLISNFQANVGAIRKARKKGKGKKKNGSNGNGAPKGSLTEFFRKRSEKKKQKKVSAFEDTLRTTRRESVTPGGKQRARAKTMTELFSQNIRSKKRSFVDRFKPRKKIGERRTNGTTQIIGGSQRSLRNNPSDPDSFFIE